MEQHPRNILKHRIACIPHGATRNGLSILFEKDLIDMHVLEMLLDAGDLTGEYDKLFAFGLVVANFGLETTQTSVAATIKLAKQFGRKISLFWSRQRWYNEHRYLLRLERARELSANCIEYDFPNIQKSLDPSAHRYLIKNSRRLAAEALRQLNCLTDYHDECLEGDTAFLSMVIDGQRYTIELTYHENQLRLGDIYKRLNSPCPSYMRSVIAQHLKLTPEQATSQRVPDGGLFQSLGNYSAYEQRMLALLNDRNYIAQQFGPQGPTRHSHSFWLQNGRELRSSRLIHDEFEVRDEDAS